MGVTTEGQGPRKVENHWLRLKPCWRGWGTLQRIVYRGPKTEAFLQSACQMPVDVFARVAQIARGVS